MGYSYCSSELNLTIYFARSPYHFPYEVILGTYGVVISHLCTWAPFLKPQSPQHEGNHFILLS